MSAPTSPDSTLLNPRVSFKEPSNETTSISSPPGQLACISTQLAQFLPRLPAELHLQILSHLPIVVLLYLASRCSYFSKLITPSTLDAMRPGTDSLPTMIICNANSRRKYLNPYRPGPSDMLHFLTKTNVCITLPTFRMRLFLLERTYQNHGALPSALICYTCFVAKPCGEFRDMQTRGGRDSGGSTAIRRACLDCEEENGKEENGEKENGEKEHDEEKHDEEKHDEKEHDEKEHDEKEHDEEKHDEEKNDEKENIKSPYVPVSRPALWKMRSDWDWDWV